MGFWGNYVFLGITGYFTCVLCFIFSLLVMRANPRSRSCQLSSLHNASIAFWSFWYATMFFTKDERFGFFVSQMIPVGTIVLSVALYHLALVETGNQDKKKYLLIINYALAGILILILFVAPRLIVNGLAPRLDIPAYPDPGPFYIVIPGQLFLCLALSLYEFQKAYRTARDEKKKKQYFIFLVAAIVGYAAGTPAYLLIYNVPLKPYTAPFVALFPIILTYGVMKYRFLNIDKLVKNTLIFSLLFVALLICVSLILHLLKTALGQFVAIPPSLSQMIAIALAISIYGPLKHLLSKWTQKLLYQNKKDGKQIFAELSEHVLHTLDRKALAERIVLQIQKVLTVRRVNFYQNTKANISAWKCLASSDSAPNNESLLDSNPLIQYLALHKTYLLASDPARQVQKNFSRNRKRNPSGSCLQSGSARLCRGLPDFRAGKTRSARFCLR